MLTGYLQVPLLHWRKLLRRQVGSSLHPGLGAAPPVADWGEGPAGSRPGKKGPSAKMLIFQGQGQQLTR